MKYPMNIHVQCAMKYQMNIHVEFAINQISINVFSNRVLYKNFHSIVVVNNM